MEEWLTKKAWGAKDFRFLEKYALFLRAADLRHRH